MDQVTGHLPPELWSTQVVAAALASCDFSTLLEEIRRAHGWTQKQLAAAVGYSQSWVSNVLRGQQALTVDQVGKYPANLAFPFTCSGSAIQEVMIRRNGVISVRPWRSRLSLCPHGQR